MRHKITPSTHPPPINQLNAPPTPNTGIVDHLPKQGHVRPARGVSGRAPLPPPRQVLPEARARLQAHVRAAVSKAFFLGLFISMGGLWICCLVWGGWVCCSGCQKAEPNHSCRSSPHTLMSFESVSLSHTPPTYTHPHRPTPCPDPTTHPIADHTLSLTITPPLTHTCTAPSWWSPTR